MKYLEQMHQLADKFINAHLCDCNHLITKNDLFNFALEVVRIVNNG